VGGLQAWSFGNRSFSNKYNLPQRQKLHPDLLGKDGEVTIVSFDFSGTRSSDAKFLLIGCIEQYQLCLLDGLCTSWGFGEDHIVPLIARLHEKGDYSLALDLLVFYHQILFSGSIAELSYTRRLVPRPIMINYNEERPINEETWILEVQSWFETTFLASRYRTFNLLSGASSDMDEWQAFLPLRSSFCDRVLFNNDNYTNFDLTQLLIIQGCLILVCIASLSGSLNNAFRKIRNKLSLARQLTQQPLQSSGLQFIVLGKMLFWKRLGYFLTIQSLINRSQGFNENVLSLRELRGDNQQHSEDIDRSNVHVTASRTPS